jgi:hypothetical protein
MTKQREDIGISIELLMGTTIGMVALTLQHY